MNSSMAELDYTRLVQLYARALDANEPELLRTIFSGDAAIVGARLQFRGIAEIEEVPQILRGKYRSTHHFIGNAFMIAKTDSDAVAETYCLASHIRTRTEDDGENYMMAIRYQDALVHQNGSWRFRRRELLVDWVETRPCKLSPQH